MSRVLTITIPLPPKGCAPNTYKHWRVVSQAKAHYRREAALCALAARAKIGANASGFAFERVKITPTFYCGPTPEEGRYRPLDKPNAWSALKAAIDGLVDARIIPADDHTRVEPMPPVLLRRKAEHGGRAEVVLEIREWEKEL